MVLSTEPADRCRAASCTMTVLASITAFALLVVGFASPASAQAVPHTNNAVVATVSRTGQAVPGPAGGVIEVQLRDPASCRKHACRATLSKPAAIVVLLVNVLAGQGQRTAVICSEFASGPAYAGGDPVNASDPSGDVIALGQGATTPWLDWQLGGCLSNQVGVDSCASPAPSAIYTLVTNCTSSLTVSAECAANVFAALGNIVWSASLPGVLTGSQIPHFCGPAGISYGAGLDAWQAAALIASGGGLFAEDEAALVAESLGRGGAAEGGTSLTAGDLSGDVLSNYNRFLKSLPSGAGDVTITQLSDWSYQFSSDVPATNIPGSYATYTKVVGPDGVTSTFFKTTIAPDGSVVSVKVKYP
jgi:hypothetical protein